MSYAIHLARAHAVMAKASQEWEAKGFEAGMIELRQLVRVELEATTSAIAGGPAVPMRVITWATDECLRQQSGEMSVGQMCEAWLYLQDDDKRETWTDMVLRVAKIVEPAKNLYGFRHQPVTIEGEVIPALDDFYRAMEQLCGAAAIFQITPEEWYREFEAIHPFNDGNGRVGALIYNFLKGTMLEPEVPPDFFGSSREDVTIRIEAATAPFEAGIEGILAHLSGLMALTTLLPIQTTEEHEAALLRLTQLEKLMQGSRETDALLAEHDELLARVASYEEGLKRLHEAVAGGSE